MHLKVYVVVVCGLLVISGPAEACNTTAIIKKLRNCVMLPVGSLASQIIEKFCENLECNIKCYIDAVGNCYTQDALFSAEPDVIKVTARAGCDRKDDILTVFTDCVQALQAPCFKNLTKAFSSAATDFSNGNYASYKTTSCSALSTFLGCFSVGTTKSCTAEKATFVESYFQTAYSLSACNIPKTNAFFTTYDGDVACSGQNLIPFSLQTLLLIAIVLVMNYK